MNLRSPFVFKIRAIALTGVLGICFWRAIGCKRMSEKYQRFLHLPPKSPILGDFEGGLVRKSPRMGDLGGGSSHCIESQWHCIESHSSSSVTQSQCIEEQSDWVTLQCQCRERDRLYRDDNINAIAPEALS
ncbi:MAG: hypothetical protein KME11_08000 [Timaviella obliquedivisa GSE-PSE-MK23-08B]|nr:hypothetical protein [Timaviella obliquedivisa GSE-PSE-MK23-08B]